ncbi:uncharacterized protein [Prorops nasuta]|uniref:uncharacterized protein n=1 Tax=Prorops nasuta TaxID=863751 RepID=UPI0034CF0A91
MTQKKWNNEAVLCLIESYKDEPCLYATNSVHYHNKHKRSEALKRICLNVSSQRPGTTEVECSTKLHNLRNQFNIENQKVKASIKSGTGFDDVYKPTLWYFDNLKFLETYFIPRKSHDSTKRYSMSRDTVKFLDNVQENLLKSSENDKEELSTTNNYHDEEPEVWLDLNILDSHQTADLEEQSIDDPIITNHVFSQKDVPLTSSRSVSPTISMASSGVDSDMNPPKSLSKTNKRKRKANTNTEYNFNDAIEKLADSMKAPVVIQSSLDIPQKDISLKALHPVNACMSFLGSIVETINTEELKFHTLNMLVNAVMEAKSKDLLLQDAV